MHAYIMRYQQSHARIHNEVLTVTRPWFLERPSFVNISCRGGVVVKKKNSMRESNYWFGMLDRSSCASIKYLGTSSSNVHVQMREGNEISNKIIFRYYTELARIRNTVVQFYSTKKSLLIMKFRIYREETKFCKIFLSQVKS